MSNESIGNRLKVETGDWFNELGLTNRKEICSKDLYPGLKIANSFFSRLFSWGQLDFITDFIDENNHPKTNEVVSIKLASLANLYGVKKGQFSHFKKFAKQARQDLKQELSSSKKKPVLEDFLERLNSKILTDEIITQSKVLTIFEGKTITILQDFYTKAPVKDSPTNIFEQVISSEETELDSEVSEKYDSSYDFEFETISESEEFKAYIISVSDSDSNFTEIFNESISDQQVFPSDQTQKNIESFAAKKMTSKNCCVIYTSRNTDELFSSSSELVQTAKSTQVIYEEVIVSQVESHIRASLEDPSVKKVLEQSLQAVANTSFFPIYLEMRECIMTWLAEVDVAMKEHNPDINTAHMNLIKISLLLYANDQASSSFINGNATTPRGFIDSLFINSETYKIEKTIRSSYHNLCSENYIDPVEDNSLENYLKHILTSESVTKSIRNIYLQLDAYSDLPPPTIEQIKAIHRTLFSGTVDLFTRFFRGSLDILRSNFFQTGLQGFGAGLCFIVRKSYQVTLNGVSFTLSSLWGYYKRRQAWQKAQEDMQRRQNPTLEKPYRTKNYLEDNPRSMTPSLLTLMQASLTQGENHTEGPTVEEID